ncbi:ABC transporter permease [Pseudomonas matsuisoli]|uniref:ABC transporter permease n=1 Tax=Pseudomonas matsuisoli TaxID=1515666 RepID=A0A917Q2D9_9PSED|nr:ABC transporter permease [Pseudomonas matsuisoli]GGK07142.1 ABC transporter permease [Pseudomonas matsuisoli]
MTSTHALSDLPRAALRGVLGVAIVGLIWEALVWALNVPSHTMPRPSQMASAVAATPDAYLSGFLRTLVETLIGFAAGAIVGIGNGVLFSKFTRLRQMVFPLFVVSQTIPVIAFGALVVLWFGNTMLAKSVIAFYLTFFPVTVNTLVGLQAVNPKQEALLRSFGASRWQMLIRLQLPTALPQIFVALRLASTLSLVGAIVGEWFGDTTGLGVLLLQAMYNENMVGLWAAILASALLGTTFYGLMALIERTCVFWRNDL